MQDFLIAVVAVGFVLGIMILIHEFGHYAAAKLFGVRVEVFSIGFGKRLLGFRRGDTDYRISLIPLGGYVKMTGENFMEERSGAPYEFMAHPRWQRFIIAAAGPFMNILLAVALLTAVFMIRYEHPLFLERAAVVGSVIDDSPAAKAGFEPGDRIVRIDGVENPNWEDVLRKVLLSPNHSLPVQVARNGEILDKTIVPHAVGPDQAGGDTGWVPQQPNIVTFVEENKPAAKAGLKVGDEITALNGKQTRTTEEMIKMLQANKSAPVEVTALRNGREMNFTVTPMLDRRDDGTEQYRIGIHSNPVHIDKLSFGEALSKSIDENKKNSLLVFDLVGKMLQRKVSVKQMSGPIGIARASGDAAKQPGWAPLMYLMAMVSLQLGLFNLFPFPILDGGMILMLAIEGIRRKDISLAVKERVYQVAFVLLVLFAALVIFNDIAKLPAFTPRLP
ncbi:MAG TPA: RIP metalloprotease RseP [Terriglobales bacterium]|nr:RIP metalloprotease RseP [Terriglobales bacterium]